MSCPICQKPTLHAYRPFCSKRCADADLGKWLTDGYAIPGQVTDEQEDDFLQSEDDTQH